MGIPILDSCCYFRLLLFLMRMGTGFGVFVNNTIKLLRMPRPMGKIQSALIDIENLIKR